MKIKGEGAYVDSVGVRHEVKGTGSLPDNTELKSLRASGMFSFGKFSCDKVSISGKCEGGSVIAKSFSVTGKVEVDSVEADDIIIESRSGAIDKLKGSKVKIFNRGHEVANALFAKLLGGHDAVQEKNSRICIKTIEADNVELENCEVDVIRCKDAFIGSNCAIEKLFVAGECKVSANSKVGETIHT